MGIDELFYGDSMWLGGYSRIKGLKLITLGILLFSCQNSFAEHPFTTSNKMKIIARDLLESSYNRVNNLPAVIDDVQSAKRANTLRNIAKKLTNVSLTLSKKNPLTGLAVSLGVGALADKAIDEGFQMFTGAQEDEHGFYVEVRDPNTYKTRKVYLEEEPNNYNPAYVWRAEKTSVFVWKSEFSECNNEDLDTAVQCTLTSALKDETNKFKDTNPFNITAQNAVSKSFSLSDSSTDTRKVFELSYVINWCLNVDNTPTNCKDEIDNRELVLTGETENIDKWKKYPLFSGDYLSKSVANKEQALITNQGDLYDLFQNLLSLQSDDFSEEERSIIYMMNPTDLYKTYTDPSLNYNDLKDFTYSEDMFDKLDKNGNSSTSNTVNNTVIDNNDNKTENEEYGSPEYPELKMPTAQEILEPFKQFFPKLQNFRLKTQSASCPKWSFEIWNRTFTIESHCPLLEEQRQLIQLIFSILWAFIALRQLLSA